MSKRGETFREKMLHLHGEQWVREEEQAFATMFPPKVTAEDVLREVRESEASALRDFVGGPTVLHINAALAQMVADYRNAQPTAPIELTESEVREKLAKCISCRAYRHLLDEEGA